MKALYGSMITPTKLHYVRSHGAVPCLDWDTHTLDVGMDESLCSDGALEEIPGLREFSESCARQLLMRDRNCYRQLQTA